MSADLKAFLDSAFLVYYRDHGTWGALHIVCDDGNLSDESVDFCLRQARDEDDDYLAEVLALKLREMPIEERVEYVLRNVHMVDDVSDDDHSWHLVENEVVMYWSRA